MKKVLIGVGVLVVLFGLFIWWGTTLEDTPQSTTTEQKAPEVTQKSIQNFTSDKGNFSIYFEGSPEYTLEPLTLESGESFPAHLYQYQDADGSVWQVFFTEYPEKAVLASNDVDSLLNTIKGTEGSIGGKLISTNVTSYQGYTAIDYEMYVEADKYYFKGRNVLNGRKLYSVAYIHGEGKTGDYQKFFDSLLIK